MGYVLIIGAKSDIAKCVAYEYAKKGYGLYLAARKSAELNAFANDLRNRTQQEVITVDFDIIAFDSHEKFYNSLSEKPFGVILVVGYLGNQDTAETNFVEAEKIIDTNFRGGVSILNIIANDFENKKQGFIVGISSVAGDRGKKSNYIYGSAKAAMTTYLSGLRNRLHKANVHVLTVKPGFVNTKMTESLKLPLFLTASPELVARNIINAQKRNLDVLYTKQIWKIIMFMIKHIPEKIFKRLNL